MVKGARKKVPFRRRRDGKTDYRKRLRLLRSGLPRAIVRRSNRYVRVQIAKFEMEGDRILASAFSKELEKYGWKHSGSNTAAAYLTGLLAARRAVGKGVKRAVLDIGLHVPSRGARVFASLKGMLDGGMVISHDDKILPSEDRISGAHIGEKIMRDLNRTKKKIAEDVQWKA